MQLSEFNLKVFESTDVKYQPIATKRLLVMLVETKPSICCLLVVLLRDKIFIGAFLLTHCNIYSRLVKACILKTWEQKILFTVFLVCHHYIYIFACIMTEQSTSCLGRQDLDRCILNATNYSI